jgi:hypothetical protein
VSTISPICGTVFSRFQSRCSSHANDTQVIGMPLSVQVVLVGADPDAGRGSHLAPCLARPSMLQQLVLSERA